jgi:hypothetical protein
MPKIGGDPRETITPDAFSVAPELLGMPLAKPWRRGVAMGIDLLLIAIIAGLRVSWLLLFLAITVLAARAALRPSATRLRKGTRWAVFGSLALFGLVATLIAGIELFDGMEPASQVASALISEDVSGDSEGFELGSLIGAATSGVALESATNEDEAREAAVQFGRSLQGLGVEPDSVREVLESMAAGRDEPWARDGIIAALDDLGLEASPTVKPSDRDSLVFAYAEALRSGDTLAMRALRDPMAESFAGDRISSLQRDNARLEDQLEVTQDELDAGERSGLLKLIFNVLNEIGIELGWSALYFTLFPIFWTGRTPGKRVARVRIVRLDGKPIGWWASLNRFGGYAASIFTGLLGFFEMFWDDNRQALQDRIASTVVVLDLKAVAGAAEGAKP